MKLLFLLATAPVFAAGPADPGWPAILHDRSDLAPALEPALSREDQDNTVMFYGDRFALKLFRKVEEGPHPEQEIGALFNEVRFPHAAPLAGAIEYRTPNGASAVAGLLHGFVRDGVPCWKYTLDHLGLFFENAMASSASGPTEEAQASLSRGVMASFIQAVRLLGLRTAPGTNERSNFKLLS